MLKFGIRARLLLAGLISIIGLAVLTFVAMDTMRTQMQQDRVTKVRNLSEVAHALVQRNYNRFKRGEVDEATAKADSIADLRDLRYDKTEYFFINDWNGFAVLNPVKPDREGKNFGDAPHVVKMREMARSEAGAGPVYYDFPRPGSDKPAPKVAFTIGFKPWSWTIATGIYIDDIETEVQATMIKLGIVLLLVAAVSGVAILIIARSITLPLGKLTGVMERLAQRDYTAEVEGQTRHDEVGAIARAVEVFKQNGKAFEELQTEHKTQESKAQAMRRQTLMDIADDFERGVAQVVDQVHSAASKMHQDAERMATSAQRTSELSSTVASAAEEAAASAQTVSAAAEQLSSSIDEIARQVASSGDISRNAVGDAGRASSVVSELENDASAIGAVLDLIHSIASQTNLLALNATIEAARAGDAGKGFAVVAGEVKTLANQTAKATEEIATKVSAIQDRTSRAAGAIHAVSDVIGRIEGISSVIAAAVQEQDAATREIARTIDQTASGARMVSSNIADVRREAETTGTEAGALLGEAGTVARQADELRTRISNFLTQVRAA